jgi:hypothetical protein
LGAAEVFGAGGYEAVAVYLAGEPDGVGVELGGGVDEGVLIPTW